MFRTVRILILMPLALSAQSQASSSDLNGQVAELRSLVQSLQARVGELEKRLGERDRAAAPNAQTTALQPQQAATPPQSSSADGFAQGTTANLLLDTYYGYNFNRPIGNANLLRAYDVTGNNFSLNQAALVIENAADPGKGKRWGARLDLQWGQATQTLQGNAANEPRPEIYRALFQVYGTYVLPVGGGLTVDFGKWGSSIGLEGNYTKDQINYSRSLWFDYLPFYHMGARLSYKANNWLTANYWITNGAQQTEDFNRFKDQLAGWVIQPNKNLSWTFNYYRGQEHPNTVFYPNGNPPSPNLPTLQGIPFQPIPNAPNGLLHILDSYVSWNASPALTFALDGDWVIERLYSYSAPQRVSGGAGYVRYQFTPRFAGAFRGEYLSDRGGLYSGTAQAIKEITFTSDYKLGEGFLMRTEYRRDFSNQPYFYTPVPGNLKKEQNTATVGLIWWFGQKQGSW